jgi:hypothetical protein
MNRSKPQPGVVADEVGSRHLLVRRSSVRDIARLRCAGKPGQPGPGIVWLGGCKSHRHGTTTPCCIISRRTFSITDRGPASARKHLKANTVGRMAVTSKDDFETKLRSSTRRPQMDMKNSGESPRSGELVSFVHEIRHDFSHRVLRWGLMHCRRKSTCCGCPSVCGDYHSGRDRRFLTLEGRTASSKVCSFLSTHFRLLLDAYRVD